MKFETHFSNIHKVIIRHLKLADTTIVIAASWVTDHDIFDVICIKARAGVKVSIALDEDEISNGREKMNFQRLENSGAQIIFLPPGSRNEPRALYEFIVIDGHTVITGSYHLRSKVGREYEHIKIIADAAEDAAKYLAVFEEKTANVGRKSPDVIDDVAVRCRLEMIRNLILLGEEADVAKQLGKLRLVPDGHQLARIIQALDNGEYRRALTEVETYLHRASAIVVTGQGEIVQLRLQLEALELHLESLLNEKAELERNLATFNRRHDEALGDLIQSVLKAQAVLARQIAALSQKAAERAGAEAVAKEAEQAYKDYAEQHKELQRAEPMRRLDTEDERELKKLYRKACSLCHPDKFSEDMKMRAHEAFVTLKAAYESNDLTRVREIYDTLKSGGLTNSRSRNQGTVGALRAAITEIEYAIARLVAELRALQASDAVRMLLAAGATEAEWPEYFEHQRQNLKAQLERIEQSIHMAKAEGAAT
jgi:cytochrome c5